MFSTRRFAPFAIATSAVLLATPAFASPRYHLTPIPYLSNGTVNSASAVNDNGVVVGTSNTIFFVDNVSTGTSRGYRWSVGTSPVDLGATDTALQNTSAAYSINNAGQTVGASRGDINLTQATIFRPAAQGGNLRIGSLGNSTSFALSNNELGQIVGYAQSASIPEAFIYENGAMRSLLGRDRTTATGINESGQISGYYQNLDVQFAPNQAFRARSDGTFVNLGTLGSGTFSFGNAINDAGDVVGSATTTAFSRPEHAFLAKGDGSPMIDLGTLGATSNEFDVSVASSINNAGQIVGSSYIDTPGSTVATTQAFLVDGGVMYNLNTLLDASGTGWKIGGATYINNVGQIVGRGINPNNEIQAYLLTPLNAATPEPTTLALGISSLVFLGSRRK